MGLYVNGQADHAGALHSFSVRNYTSVGDVTNHHPGWEFVFGNQLASLGIEFDFRKRRYDLAQIPGLVYNAQEDHHEFYHRAHSTLAALVISEDFINGYLGDFEHAANFSFQNPLLSDGRTYRFAHSVYQLLRTGCLSRIESVALAEALVFEAIDSLTHDRVRVKNSLATTYQMRFLFKEIICELHKNLSRADFDLDQMSSELGVTKFHIIRTTNKIGGFTPYSHLIKIRLLHARDLLLNSREPIGEIALRCGFDDLSTFNKAFKKLFRKAPSAFRSSPDRRSV